MNCGQWVSTAGVNGHLPIVLRRVLPGGAKGTRTPDPLLAKQVLFQLSYSPKRALRLPVTAAGRAAR